jgi:hypothetical protein
MPATWGAAKLVPVAIEYVMLPAVAQAKPTQERKPCQQP